MNYKVVLYFENIVEEYQIANEFNIDYTKCYFIYAPFHLEIGELTPSEFSKTRCELLCKITNPYSAVTRNDWISRKKKYESIVELISCKMKETNMLYLFMKKSSTSFCGLLYLCEQLCLIGNNYKINVLFYDGNLKNERFVLTDLKIKELACYWKKLKKENMILRVLDLEKNKIISVDEMYYDKLIFDKIGNNEIIQKEIYDYFAINGIPILFVNYRINRLIEDEKVLIVNDDELIHNRIIKLKSNTV